MSTGNSGEYITFGAVHLSNTSREKAIEFWTKICGMKQRNTIDDRIEFGSESKTLVIIHISAKKPFVEGYSGLYHIAIHVRDAQELAQVLYRIKQNNYPCSPTDHTMSKSIYLNDPDGITIEFTLETPERLKRLIQGGIMLEGTDGIIRSAVSTLDTQEVLGQLVDTNIDSIISNVAKIGHIHLYANNLEKLNIFYKDLGFESFVSLLDIGFCDVGAGGKYTHRIAMNTFHGRDKPLAPKENAGMLYFHIIYDGQERLQHALKNIENFKETKEGFWTTDSTGNKILLTYN